MGQPPPPVKQPESKHDQLVIVRGRVQTKASVECDDSKQDAEALMALNVPEKAVYVERTQTVLFHSRSVSLA